jgi:hypothetical protein
MILLLDPHNILDELTRSLLSVEKMLRQFLKKSMVVKKNQK